MNDLDTDRRQVIGLFRYGLVTDLLQPSPDDKGLYARLAAQAALDYTIPGSSRTRVAAETLRDWLKVVKRERPARTLTADGPAPQPSASALRLRELDREER